MKIIFHHPLPLDPNAVSASGIRPQKILQAFRDAGCDVDMVVGYCSDRKKAIDRIKKNILGGEKYSFLYSESSTMPTALTNPSHFPSSPFLDVKLFSLCKKNSIPIGVFYRDIYWAFSDYMDRVGFLKGGMARLFYYFDLFFYNRYLTRLYLPSKEMGRYIPIVPSEIFSELPPGHDEIQGYRMSQRTDDSKRRLKIFYVGGMSDHYQMHKLFSVVSSRNDVELIVCTREEEWNRVKSGYLMNHDNIRVVHESGKKMQSIMSEADIVSLFVKPQEYREFASPVKLYEYLGHCKPIMASEGTLSGRFVTENKVGWSIKYDEGELNRFFDYLISQPTVVSAVEMQIQAIASHHTWNARVRQVIKELAR